MQFFKIYGELAKSEAPKGGKKKSDLPYKIAARTADFNGNNNKSFCFLADVGEAVASFGLIITDTINLVEYAKKYAKRIGVVATFSTPDEITLSNMQNLLSGANRQG